LGAVACVLAGLSVALGNDGQAALEAFIPDVNSQEAHRLGPWLENREFRLTNAAGAHPSSREKGGILKDAPAYCTPLLFP